MGTISKEAYFLRLVGTSIDIPTNDECVFAVNFTTGDCCTKDPKTNKYVCDDGTVFDSPKHALDEKYWLFSVKLIKEVFFESGKRKETVVAENIGLNDRTIWQAKKSRFRLGRVDIDENLLRDDDEKTKNDIRSKLEDILLSEVDSCREETDLIISLCKTDLSFANLMSTLKSTKNVNIGFKNMLEQIIE
jgi:hypothetical protein